MSIKIGLLTTYYSKNYGAALQAYATAEKLKNMGYDCEMIGYKKNRNVFYAPHSTVESENKMPFSAKFKRKAKNALIKLKRSDRNLAEGSAVRDREFEKFAEDFFDMSDAKYTSSEEFLADLPNMQYDAFLCGSDQIWNPIVHNFDDIYYLNFPTDAKKVAYASSVAYNNFDESEIKRLSDCIQSIDSISVRERSTVEWLQPYSQKKINHVIDPTFLLDRNDWLKLESDKSFDGKYILVYLLNYNEHNKNTVSLISDLARKIGARVICLPYTTLKFSKDIEVERRYDIAPNDFIKLLSGAVCVVTNSFHATALSINLNIPFYVVSSKDKHKDLQTRLSDLLEEVGLEERRIYSDTPSINNEKVDFTHANSVIEKRRAMGIKYLRDALEVDNE